MAMVEAASSGLGPDLVESIVRYYEDTWFDYSSLWARRADPAFHYGYYDETSRHHRQAIANANATLAALARVERGDKVLDAGCGRGGSCFWLAENRGAIPVGVNLVASQLEYAQREANRRGLSRQIELRRADFTNTPFDSGSFDVVWALESLCHSPTKRTFYAEASRLLKPGGRLVVAEYMLTDITMGPTDLRLVESWLNGWSIPSLDTEEQHLANAAYAGFQAITIRDWTASMTRSSLRLYCMARLCHWLSWLLNRAGLRSDVAHANLLSARYQYEALRKGLWRYKILSAEKP